MKTATLACVLLPVLSPVVPMGSEEDKPASLKDIFAPVVVGTPPSDAFRTRIEITSRIPTGDPEYHSAALRETRDEPAN